VKTIAVVAVTSQKIREHKQAIARTVVELPFHRVETLLVVRPYPNTVEGISRYILSELPDHIHTEFIVIVHWDGFALNGQNWTDEFLEYDYIGAPWTPGMVAPYTRYPEAHRVGNGGFSLRSRKWLETCKVFYPQYTGFNEDVWCCLTMQEAFEKAGCKFAPLDIAHKWSFEHPMDGYDDHTRSFGFHGRHLVNRFAQ
jgi:hypothetical protein